MAILSIFNAKVSNLSNYTNKSKKYMNIIGNLKDNTTTTNIHINTIA